MHHLGDSPTRDNIKEDSFPRFTPLLDYRFTASVTHVDVNSVVEISNEAITLNEFTFHQANEAQIDVGTGKFTEKF